MLHRRLTAKRRIFSYAAFGLSLIELLVVLFILFLLLAMLFPAIQMMRASSQKSNCANNLRQVALAGISFESSRGKFEIDGWPLDYAPFLELNDFVGNVFPVEQLKNRTIAFLTCPSDGFPSSRSDGILTNYMGCTGSRYYEKFSDGIFNASQQFEWSGNLVGSADVTDGLDHTVFFSELVFASTEFDVIKRAVWLVPGSYLEEDYDDFVAVADSIPSEENGLIPVGIKGLVYVFNEPVRADAPSGSQQVFSIVRSPGVDLYSHALTPQRPSLQLAQGSPSYSAYTASSNHDVVNVSFASGATRSYTSRVDPIVWRAISTRAGQELVR